jgi:predicted nucleotidyltransferase
MTMIDESTIVEAGRRIAAAAPDARVILFGSYARETRVDGLGDIDLLVIEPSVEDPAEESVRLRRALKGMGVPVDVVVVDEDRARRRASVTGTMIERALREGRVLVDA